MKCTVDTSRKATYGQDTLIWGTFLLNDTKCATIYDFPFSWRVLLPLMRSPLPRFAVLLSFGWASDTCKQDMLISRWIMTCLVMENKLHNAQVLNVLIWNMNASYDQRHQTIKNQTSSFSWRSASLSLACAAAAATSCNHRPCQSNLHYKYWVSSG